MKPSALPSALQLEARIEELERERDHWIVQVQKADARIALLDQTLRRAVRWAEDSGRTELWVSSARDVLE